MQFIALLLTLAAADPSTLSIQEIEQRAIGHRRAIRSGIVKLDSRYHVHGGDRKGWSEHVQITVYFDGEKIRGDYIKPYDDGWKEGESFLEVVSHADGLFRFYSTQTFPSGGRASTDIQPESDSVSQVYQVPHPRLIGMAMRCYANLIQMELDTILGITEKNVTKEPDARNGLRCVKLTYSRSNGEIHVWLAPERDFNPIAMEGHFGETLYRLECRLGEVEGFGWFPVHAHMQNFEQGELIDEEVLEVEVVQFNQPLPEDTFKFTGMGVPEGTYITDSTGDNTIRDDRTGEVHQIPQHYLMGTNGLVKTDGPPLSIIRGAKPPSAPQDLGQRVKWLLVANGVLFALLGLWLIWRWRSRNSPAANSHEA